MLSTRAVGLGSALRKSAFSPRLVPNRASILLSKRSIQIESFPASTANELLNKQRIVRPSSPHFTIYQPQLTWIASIVNRVTGAGLSVALYGFSLAYLFAPTTFDSVSVVEYIHTLPEAVKYAGKVIFAAPFMFHSFNGVRHLSWDALKLLKIKSVYTSGYVVIGASILSTIAVLFI